MFQSAVSPIIAADSRDRLCNPTLLAEAVLLGDAVLLAEVGEESLPLLYCCFPDKKLVDFGIEVDSNSCLKQRQTCL